ncbi:WXG100 family type VII secretion target [Streptomyces sp. NPDC091209]|uniref:WXG100 family type VII secretion target n=1 Tax=Streptomyces sp. NPDC091209 TaxID=3365974 RepID=UPI003819BF2D
MDTNGLHEQSPYMQNLAARFKGLSADLQARLDGLGECWGDDTTGRQFVSEYADPRDGLVKGIGEFGLVMDSTVDGITTMAVRFERLEDENVHSLRNLGLSGDGPHISGPEGRPGKE